MKLFLNDLNKQFEQLKLIFECPRLYISNYFTELRCQIDLAFIQQSINNQSNSNINNNDWSQIIETIDSYELKCFKSKPSNKFNLKLSQEINQKIRLIDRVLKQIALKENDDLSRQLYDLHNLIYGEVFKLEKLLFLNQTAIFVPKNNCQFGGIFDKMDQSAVGKLIIAKNEYFGQKSIQFLNR